MPKVENRQAQASQVFLEELQQKNGKNEQAAELRKFQVINDLLKFEEQWRDLGKIRDGSYRRYDTDPQAVDDSCGCSCTDCESCRL